MFGGEIHSKNYDDWNISWESLGNYRFWCSQKHPANTKTTAVVMLNPGSLSGSGENLSKDTTLRVLRELFIGTNYNPFIINLFNRATTDPAILFNEWEQRDHPIFQYTHLPKKEISSVLYAYGNYENKKFYPSDIKARIFEIREFLSDIPEIIVPKNQSGTPMHPIRVQCEKLKDTFREAIITHSLANITL